MTKTDQTHPRNKHVIITSFWRNNYVFITLCVCWVSNDDISTTKQSTTKTRCLFHGTYNIYKHIHQLYISWWRHQMETFSALLAIRAGNSPVPGDFPTQRPVTRSFDVFFDLRLNKRLSKQSGGWWFEMPSRPLWRHCNVSILGLCIKIVPLSMQCVPRWMEYMWNLALRTGPTIMILAAAPRISCATKVSFTTLPQWRPFLSKNSQCTPKTRWWSWGVCCMVWVRNMTYTKT